MQRAPGPFFHQKTTRLVLYTSQSSVGNLVAICDTWCSFFPLSSLNSMCGCVRFARFRLFFSELALYSQVVPVDPDNTELFKSNALSLSV